MIQDTKEEILSLIQNNVHRNGVESLLKFMIESDFFVCPASTIHHGNFRFGLSSHSWFVYQKLKQKVEEYKLPYTEENVIISSIFHDIAKVNYYKEKKFEPITSSQLRYLKDLQPNFQIKDGISKGYASVLIDFFKNDGLIEELPVEKTEYIIQDDLPLSHDSKAVYLLQKYIQLEDCEALAIAHHMSWFNPAVHFNSSERYAFIKAIETTPLVVVLATSDWEVSSLLKI